MKRKNLPNDEFEIENYNINDIKSLIKMIEDYQTKFCPKKIKKQLPKKFDKLTNILEELYELDEMIGLETLKKQVIDQIIFFVKEINEEIMMHTVIYGSPGTGKTTVARIMAKIYTGLGILKKNKFVEVKREDLIGQYLGETTIKTMDTLDSCRKGVMFIDEAYSLGDDSTGDSYSKEAINAINQYLTEHSHELICIIAGYKQELETCFFSKNPGLKRRFPWTFNIENFTAENLVDVLKIKIENSEWEFEDNYDKILELIKKNYNLFTGNGGDINNIFGKAKIINTRKNFLNDNKKLTQEDFIEAIEQFKMNSLLSTSDPPYGMYT